MSSARVSLVESEEDSKVRATKKVKSRQDSEEDHEVGMTVEHPVSFKEALLNVSGGESEDSLDSEDWNEEDLPENRWYKEVEEPMAVDDVSPGGFPEIKVSDKELAEWSKEWAKTLVVNVLGKKVNYRMIENKAKRDWARLGGVKVIDMPRGFFAVHFEQDEDYKHALFEGPWMIADHYLLVQRWRPNFLNSAKRESKVAVWVRIPELPLELYNKTFLERVGKALGTFLRMDHLTSIQSRGRFARFCAEIDLAKPLTPFVLFRGEKVKLEFEGLHAVCFKCGVYGHRSEACYVHKPEHNAPMHSPECSVEAIGGLAGEKEMVTGEIETLVVEGQKGDGDRACPSLGSKEKIGIEAGSKLVVGDIIPNPEEECEEGAFGPWMLVKRNKKKKGQLKSDQFVRREIDGRRQNQNSRPAAGNPKSTNTANSHKPQGNGQVDKREGAQPQANKGPDIGTSYGPPLVIYEDQTMEVVPRQPAKTVIVKRHNGGKNHHLGPRVRDSKKAARAIGTLKKALQDINGPSEAIRKENLPPLVNGVGKGTLPFVNVTEMGTVRTQQVVEKLSVKNNSSKVEGMLPAKGQGPLDSVFDPNPLMGFIEHIDVNVSRKDIGDDTQPLKSAVVSQREIMLSEQQTPNQYQ